MTFSLRLALAPKAILLFLGYSPSTTRCTINL
eukprot:CAMPEP_0201523344 /NCGR_PEP_ID=MMETSP0161_2-20130828/19512_1 /ASSEMBLY_ACC=CAM_ASM_000251 /TAXON_ID=180227 /ORGANISM="Neoparamoeba aestuarina, Strain SoJaBio B1-5/56/2" /LENGTH=31 /DNA_ID= /DNA_START= /DNA_END= /DNA_ORIENTATION=